MMFTEKVGGSESEDQSFFCAMVAFSKLSVMVAAPAAANQLFAAPAPFAAAPQARRQRTLSSPMYSIYSGIGVFFTAARVNVRSPRQQMRRTVAKTLTLYTRFFIFPRAFV